MNCKQAQSKKKLFAAVGVILAAISVIISPIIAGAAAASRPLPIYSVNRNDKYISISFDAAWGNEDTQALIDILEKYGVKTTFFVVGEWVDKYPESVRALSDKGHEIMSHSLDHAHFSQLSTEEIRSNVAACSDKIEKITGKAPFLFRCPYGEYNDHVITTLHDMGIYPIQWSVDSLDWKGIPAQEIQERVLSQVESGSIVLFHNAAKHTPEALPGIIEQLQTDGYTIVPISELIYRSDYEIDHTGKQYLKKNG